MYSEMVAINSQGQLCQWRWADPEPHMGLDNPTHCHPKTAALALASEKVSTISNENGGQGKGKYVRHAPGLIF